MILGMEERRFTDTTTFWLTAGGIALLAFVTFAPAIRGEFFFDDEILIVKNPRVTEPGGVWDSWTTLEQTDYYPLTWSLLWLEWQMWGPYSARYHVVGILLHCLSSVLVWRVLVRLKVPGAVVAALLFAVHPTGAESVAWISEQKNTLAMVFFLLTILAWLRFDDGEGRGWYAAALALFVAALLSKASVVMLPVVLLLLAWWRAGRTRDEEQPAPASPSPGRVALLLLPFFIASAAAAWVAMTTQATNIGTTLGRPEGEGFATHLAASGMAVWFYLYKSLLPIRLAIVYPRWEINAGSPLSYVPTVAGVVARAGGGVGRARCLGTCAGLHSDRVARAAGARSALRILPFRGEYLTLSKERAAGVRRLVYPVPDPRLPFLGVHLTPGVDGEVEAGPNAVLALAREGYRWRDVRLGDVWEAVTFPGLWRLVLRHGRAALSEVVRSLSRRASARALRRLYPSLEAGDLRPGGAGVRAQALTAAGQLCDDFEIVEADGAVHVLNAPSPAATASLPIGERIAARAAEVFGLG